MDVIRWFDRVLRSIGRNGGSSIREPVIRLFFMESILVTTIFAAWYLSGPLSPFGLMSILIAAFYVLSIHRVWSENEKLRREIAQRIIDDDPDQHPDLRLNVLIVSMHLIVIVPLLLWRLNDVFNIYSVPEDATGMDWWLFGIDLLSRSLLDWAEVYEVKWSRIEPDAWLGRHIVLALLILIDVLLIQSILRLLSIHRTIREGVLAAGRDPETAARIGRRVNIPLVRSILDDSTDEERKNRIRALALTGSSEDAMRIWPLLNESDLRSEILATLVRIGPLTLTDRLLSSDSTALRLAAIQWLKIVDEDEAWKRIVRTANDPDSAVRASVIVAIDSAPIRYAIPVIIRLVRDTDANVALEASRQLRKLDDAETLLRISRPLLDTGSSGVKIHTIDALSQIEDGRVVSLIVSMFDDSDENVRSAAQQAIEHLKRIAST